MWKQIMLSVRGPSSIPEVTAGRQPLELPLQHRVRFSTSPAGLPPPPGCATGGSATAPLAPLGTQRCAACRGCRVRRGDRTDRPHLRCCGGTPAGVDIFVPAVVRASSWLPLIASFRSCEFLVGELQAVGGWVGLRGDFVPRLYELLVCFFFSVSCSLLCCHSCGLLLCSWCGTQYSSCTDLDPVRPAPHAWDVVGRVQIRGIERREGACAPLGGGPSSRDGCGPC